VELADMSKTGNYGEVPGNANSDMMCRFVKDVCIPEPMNGAGGNLPGYQILEKGESHGQPFSAPHHVCTAGYTGKFP
jgi:hypothetical protein